MDGRRPPYPSRVIGYGLIGYWLFSSTDPPYSPPRMFRNERLRIVRRPFERRQTRSISAIPERHTNIPQQAASFRSPHRCSAKLLFETRFVQFEQFQQIRSL